MTRLFGTDGVRGTAGTPPLDRPTIRRLGAALARALSESGGEVRILAGRDTRESGPWIERELAYGIASQGGTLVSAGVIPTPAIAYLTRRHGYAVGVVISASHNPFEDNGIKVFLGSGEKFSASQEARIEAIVDDDSWQVPAGDARAVVTADLVDDYLDHVALMLPADLRSVPARVAVDCANGATSAVAPLLFRRLAIEASFVGVDPDGRNINLGCGSTAPHMLARTVVDGGFALGVAYDGDGDRAIFVDESGRIVDGDAVMLMCATQMKREGRLKRDTVAATVMSNLGLEVALREAGIDMIRSAVGDKYVMDEMLKRGLSLGGEQSGHIIFAEHLFTGDGLATSLAVLRVMASTGRTLGQLASDLTTYPQVLLNLRVARKVDLDSVPAIAAVVSAVESRLSGQGRLLVRYSGTEPLLRVMLEGRSEPDIRRWGQEIIDAARQHLGAA